MFPIHRPRSQRTDESPSRPREKGKGFFGGLNAFWRKANNDWIFNLASFLAYNLLISIFPLVLGLLAVTNYILGQAAPAASQAIVNALVSVLPGNVAAPVVTIAQTRLPSTFDPLVIFSIVAALVIGSRLFVVMENCFGIIYRLPSRSLIRQNVIAVLMLLLYLILVPVVFLASSIANGLTTAIDLGPSPLQSVIAHGLSLLIAFISAVLLVGAIYVVVPNRLVPWREVWVGTLGASVLVLLYQQVFPIYETLFLKPSNYGSGSILGLAVVIVIFFYYVAFIVLLGAEFNSFAVGLRATPEDIPTLLYDVLIQHTEPSLLGFVKPPAPAQVRAEFAAERSTERSEAQEAHRE